MSSVPCVSIVTPCFNVAPYVERMIQSVQSQTFTDWEQILVDDGSTDHTAEAIRAAIGTDTRQRLITTTNGGVCAARNRGYAEATDGTKYVYFPDPDDTLAPDLLETMVGYMEAHPMVSMAYCAFQWVDLNDEPLTTPAGARYVPSGLGVRALHDDEPETPFVSLYCWAPAPEPVAFIRRSAYDRTTGWDEAFGQHGEGVILFPQLTFYGDVHYVPRRLYRYRVRPGQSSRMAGKQERAERRVVDWWRMAEWLTDEQRSTVRQAEWFRYYRLDPWKGIRTAWSDARSGRVLRATRFTLGALRRYAQSLVTGSGAGRRRVHCA